MDRHLAAAVQRVGDWLVFALVELWVILRHPWLWGELQWGEWWQGALWSRVAVPRHANEKYLWRRVFDHDPRFTVLSDKIACKEWLATLDVGVALPRTLWTGQDARDIPDALLAGDVFIKGAHGWNMNIRVTGSVPARSEWEARANGFLRRGHGRKSHEWGYFNAPRRLMVEEAVGGARPVADIKVYVCGTYPERLVMIYRGDATAGSFWHPQGDALDPATYEKGAEPLVGYNLIDPHPLPPTARQALLAASVIGAHFDAMRVDFLTDGESLWLGELTVYNRGGKTSREGPLAHDVMTRRWDLRRTWFLNMPQRGWRGLYAAALRRALDRRARKWPLLNEPGPLPPEALAHMRKLTGVDTG